jgi:mannose/fructose-specific phosphotransferase system component IIA
MIGVLLVTHGDIGHAILISAEQILDEIPAQVATLSV